MNEQTYDMSKERPSNCRFERQVGNRLHCVLPGHNEYVTVAVNQHLFRKEDGSFELKTVA